jgi:hypothetical protein
MQFRHTYVILRLVLQVERLIANNLILSVHNSKSIPSQDFIFNARVRLQLE